jgi:hypothetical protein
MKIHVTYCFLLFCLMLSPIAVRADAQQDQSACMNDAMTICGQFIPDRESVGRCLLANQRKISPACRVAMRRFKPR